MTEERFDFRADIEDLLRRAVTEFSEWMSANWNMSEREAECLTDPTASPAEYARGYNDAIRSIKDAAETWMEDHP